MSELEDAIVQARDQVHLAYGNHAAAQDGNCADGGPKYWRNCKHIDAALARLERLVRLAGEWDEHLEHRDFVDEARPQYCASCHKTRCSLEAEIAEAVK